MSDHLYLWAIMPPEPLYSEIDAIRHSFAANFHSVAALKPPVHITLYKPFRIPAPVADAEAGQFERWIGTQPDFSLELKNFGFFENARSPVVYIHVVPEPNLKKLNTGLSQLTRKLFDLEQETGNNTYHPHLTIGYRDILPVFPEVKQAYSRRLFTAGFHVPDVCLFRHNGKVWELKHRFLLQHLRVQQSLW